MALYRAFRGLSIGVLFGMAGLAEGLKVRIPMGAPLEQRDDVMNVLRWNQAASGLAEFAKRVPGNLGITDLLPVPVVELTYIPAGLIVLFGFLRLMQGAVFPRRCIRAAGDAAGLLWSPSHGDHLKLSLLFFVF